MQTRNLGAQGLKSSEIALGCMGMSDMYGPSDRAESIATIHRAIELGVTLLDTGDFYGMGHNELLIREAIQGRRDRVQLSVKFGAMRDPSGAFVGFDGRPASVKNFLAYSLKRLGVDYIDFYFPSRVDKTVPIEETIGAVSEMVKAGYVRFVGVSEASAQTIRRAHKTHPLSAVEIEYSLFSRDIEDEVLPTCRELGVGLLAYGVFSRGLFGGQLDVTKLGPGDFRRHLPRFQGENLERNQRIERELESFAKEKGVSVPQLCVAWVLAQSREIVPVVGTKRRKYLEENLAAAELQLSAEDLKRLGELVPRGSVAGTRYGAAQMAMLNG